MKTLGWAAVVVLVGAQLLAFAHPDRRVVLWAGAAAAAAVLLTVRWFLDRDARSVIDESRARDPAEALRRWRSKTEILIARADSSRSDWDKYLRPMLARQFELATGQRKAKDARAFHATALALFGEELWPWVDPDNVSRSRGVTEPGPGRAVLNEVLRRLEGI
ncbi:MAG: hypothetical protein ABW001_15905 [Mycobacterium sp.]